LETFLEELMKTMRKYVQAFIGLFIKTSELNSRLLSASTGGGRRTLEDVRDLLDRGANVNAITEHASWTPLHFAAWYGHVDTARFLLDRGAKMEAEAEQDWTPPRKKWTPLRMAAWRGHVDVAWFLIHAGADISAGFGSLDKLEDLFGGDISWIPQERLPPEWRKRQRSRGAFGRF
jgi:ankyrin repeat protein